LLGLILLGGAGIVNITLILLRFSESNLYDEFSSTEFFLLKGSKSLLLVFCGLQLDKSESLRAAVSLENNVSLDDIEILEGLS